MRSLAMFRFSVAACGLAALGAAAVQVVNLPVSIPVQQLQVAWALTRFLIQL